MSPKLNTDLVFIHLGFVSTTISAVFVKFFQRKALVLNLVQLVWCTNTLDVNLFKVCFHYSAREELFAFSLPLAQATTNCYN